MNKEFDAIVVGGGIAGLTSAAYLCRYGYRTLVCDRYHKTGGLIDMFWHQGYALDAGVRAFENAGILLPMLKSLGLEMDFTPDPVSVGIENQWIRLCSRDSLKNYAKMLADIFPENPSEIDKIEQEIQRVIGCLEGLYRIDNPLILEDGKGGGYPLKRLLPWFFSYQVDLRKAGRLGKPAAEHLKRFTDNQALIDMVIQHFFKDTPAFFALSCFGRYLDYLYPKGGTGALAQAVTDYIRRAGGEILNNTPVIGVDAYQKQVHTEGGDTYRYKKLVWAADQKSLYAAVGKTHSAQLIRQSDLVGKGQSGESVLSLFMGVDLDGSYFTNRCGAHAFYTPAATGLSSLPDWHQSVATEEGLLEWVGAYLGRTTYEISCPALRDASLAPEGKTGVMVSTLMDYRLAKYFSDKGSYQRYKEFCTKRIIEVLEASAFSGITEKVEFAICSTPLTVERESGNTHGAVAGWSFTNDKLPAESRFREIKRSVKTPIKDVYQCGQWTFSPSGLPVSILTGKLAADSIQKALKAKGS